MWARGPGSVIMRGHSVAAGVLALGAGAAAAGDAFETYGRVWESIAMPPIGAGSFDLKGDVLADGRLVVVTGLEVLVETAPGSRAFDVRARLSSADFSGATDPAFLAVSPGGARVVVGGGFGKPLVVFDAALLEAPGGVDLSDGVDGTRILAAEHFDAAWYDDDTLALTAGTFGQPARVDLLDLGGVTPTLATVVNNIGGAPAGVAFDAQGRLYTGNGFDLGGGGSTTGTIRAFDAQLWSTGAPADFEASGVLVGDVLSAASIRFDREGNLFVGGGDFASGDAGYLGVIAADAIAAALFGGGAINPEDPDQLLRLDPTGLGFSFFGSAYDSATGTLFATDGSAWYATVPAPATLPVLASIAWAARRRR